MKCGLVIEEITEIANAKEETPERRIAALKEIREALDKLANDLMAEAIENNPPR